MILEGIYNYLSVTKIFVVYLGCIQLSLSSSAEMLIYETTNL